MASSPDCVYGKHRACHGDAWDSVMDSPAECGCDCHRGGTVVNPTRQHFPTEDAFGITHGITLEQALGLTAAQFQFLNEAPDTIRRLRGVIEQKQIEGN